jgi:hypothetical protein
LVDCAIGVTGLRKTWTNLSDLRAKVALVFANGKVASAKECFKVAQKFVTRLVVEFRHRGEGRFCLRGLARFPAGAAIRSPYEVRAEDFGNSSAVLLARRQGSEPGGEPSRHAVGESRDSICADYFH